MKKRTKRVIKMIMNDIQPAGVPMMKMNDLVDTVKDDQDQDNKDGFDFNLYIGDIDVQTER